MNLPNMLAAVAAGWLFLAMPYCAFQDPDGPRWVDYAQDAVYRVFAQPEQLHTDATVYVTAEFPDSWTFRGSSYTGTVAGTPIAGTGTLLPGDPGICAEDMGPVRPGYFRVFLSEGPFAVLDPAENDQALVELAVATGTSTETYEIHMWVNVVDATGVYCDDGSWLPVLQSENPEWEELVGGTVPLGFGHRGYINDVVEFEGAFFVTLSASNAEIWRSADVANWEQVFSWGDSPYTGHDSQRFCNSAISNDHVYVGLSDSHLNTYGVGCRIWRSADGLVWEPSLVEPAPCRLDSLFSFNEQLYAVVAHQYLYQRPRLLTSADGVTWEIIADFPETVIDVRSTQLFAQSVFFAGNSGSPPDADICRFDGATVSAAGIGGCYHSDALTVLNDNLLVGCWGAEGAEIWRTPDGQSWERIVAFGFEYDDAVIGLAAHENRLFAWPDRFSVIDAVFVTEDLVNWRESQLSGALTQQNVEVLTSVGSQLFASFGGQLWRWQVLFADSFETGDLSPWSQATP